MGSTSRYKNRVPMGAHFRAYSMLHMDDRSSDEDEDNVLVSYQLIFSSDGLGPDSVGVGFCRS